MGKKFIGDIKQGLNFTSTKAAPLDDRTVVQTKSDLLSIDKKTAYEGLVISVLSESKQYMLKDITKISSEDYSGWKLQNSDDNDNAITGEYIMSEDYDVIESSSSWKKDYAYFIYEDLESVEIPSDVYVSFDNVSHTIASTDAYVSTGTSIINPGKSIFTLKLNTEYCWKDKTFDDKQVNLIIYKPADRIISETFLTDGETLKKIESTDAYTVTGTGGSHYGVYTFILKLNNGYLWSDTKTNEDLTITYTIVNKDWKFGGTFPLAFNS